MLETTLDVVRGGIDNLMTIGKNKNIPHILEKIGLSHSIEHIRLLDEKGFIKFSSDTTEINQNVFILSPDHQLPELSVKERLIYVRGHDKIYSAIEPIRNEPKCQACHGSEQKVLAYLDIDTEFTSAERNFYTGSVHIIFLAIVIIVVLTSGFYFLFNRFINLPLKLQIKAMDSVERGKLDTRLIIRNEDEFGILGRHFNQMVERLQKSQKEIDDLNFEQLQRADKLVTLGELAAEMAHEINNPAAVIMSRTEYLQLEKENSPELKKYNEDFETILNQTSKISKITGNILKYGKKLPKSFAGIEISQIIQESINIVEPRLRKKGIKLTQNINCPNGKIFGDSIQCEQMITNLINNAIDAIDKDGQILISLSRSDEDHLLLQIQDNGHGMDEHTRGQIFAPFFTTKSSGKGTGLGLYIVKNICNNHGAKIVCESELNQGTTFKITFPKMKGK